MKSKREPRGHRQLQLMPERIHDPYKATRKPGSHARCPDCGVVFQDGRWQWPESIAVDKAAVDKAAAEEARCPACHRIHDKLPAGFVRLEGPFFDAHRAEVLQAVRNHEAHMKAEHPLERIMGVDEHADHTLVTTTEIHLARGIGETLHHAYRGELDYAYSDAEALLRVRWRR